MDAIRSDWSPALGGHRRSCNGREPELSGLRRSMLPPLVVHVEDEPLMRKFVAMILAMYGYRVRGFSEGEPALAFCEKTPPRLLITDVSHPGTLDGIELCRVVRSKAVFDATDLMILT